MEFRPPHPLPGWRAHSAGKITSTCVMSEEEHENDNRDLLEIVWEGIPVTTWRLTA